MTGIRNSVYHCNSLIEAIRVSDQPEGAASAAGKKPTNAFANIIALREEFPGADQWRYFDVAARGLLPLSARRAINADLDARMNNGGNKPEMFSTIESVRERFARMIGAEADEIAITKNISEGLNIVGIGYPWVAGDNVVVCAEREHPNNVYVWLHLARTRDVEVRMVKSVAGRIPTDEVLAAMDDRTRIVTASTVSFVPGLRTNLDVIGDACRRRDILLLADAAQSAGILKSDVRRTAVDAIACSTQKGLLGLYGMGLLYVRREWAERLTPTYLARFSVNLGDAHEADLGAPDFRFMPGARRYDLGNYNFTAAAGLNASLALLEAAGVDTVEAYVMSLSRQLGEGLREAGFTIAGGGNLTPAALEIAERAIKNLLVYMEILPENYRIEPKEKMRLLEVGGTEYFVYASADGVFEPLVELGDMVAKGQLAGRIHFLETPWREPETVHFEHEGFVLCKRIIGRTVRGDCLFHLGTDTNL